MNLLSHSIGPLAAALLLGLPAAAQQQQQPRHRVSLKQALQAAAEHGPDVAAARAQAAVAGSSVNKAWTAWQPDISASGTFDHTSAPAVLDFGALINQIGATLLPGFTPLPPDKLPPPTTIVAENSRYGTLQLVQPLLTPQGLFLPGAAKAGAEAADRGADEAREQVLLGVARAYLGLQGLEGLLDAAREAEKVALKREDDAKAQISAGTAVEISLLRAQTETAGARLQLAQLQGQKDSLLPLLEALTGEPVEPLPLGTAEELGSTGIDVNEPWEQSFAVQSAIAAVRASEKLVTLDKFLWLPSVAGIAKGNYTSNAGFTGKNTSYDLILNVSIPLYDRGTRYAQLHEDEAKLQQAQAQLASARARARAAWLGARANLAAAQSASEQAVIQAQLAAKAQVQVDAAAKAGVATSLDLSDADQKKFLAQSAAAQARASVDIRKAEIAAAEGKLFKLAAP